MNKYYFVLLLSHLRQFVRVAYIFFILSYWYVGLVLFQFSLILYLRLPWLRGINEISIFLAIYYIFSFLILILMHWEVVKKTFQVQYSTINLLAMNLLLCVPLFFFAGEHAILILTLVKLIFISKKYYFLNSELKFFWWSFDTDTCLFFDRNLVFY